MNILLAMIIYSGILFTWGETYLDNANVKYGYEFNEAGEKLGFEDGDKIVSIDGEVVGDSQNIGMQLLISDSDRKVDIMRHNKPQTLTISLDKLVSMRENEGYKGLYTAIEPYIVEEATSEAAVMSGFRNGDQIVGIGDKALYSGESIREELLAHKGEEVNITVLRYEDNAPVRDTLTTTITNEGAIADVTLTMDTIDMTHVEYGFFESIPAGIKVVGNEISSYWNQLKMIIDPDTKLYKEVGGFLSIGSIFPDTWDWYSFWRITALISIILAVMNILPIPGLDGGHALFTIWEIITRRKPSEKFLEVMQWIGLVILFALLIYANGNDIFKLFS
jgi:regulator of sigma E protease